MLVTFKSKASGDVMMFGDVAQRLLGVMGKRVDKQGIITVEQLPDAITRLKHAALESKAQQARLPDEDKPEVEKSPGGGERAYVSLAVRAAPLIELLEHALKARTPVTWGV